MLDSILAFLASHPYSGFCGLLFACSFGFPFSKTLAILGAGILASRGIGSVNVYIPAALISLVICDFAYYLLGYWGGEKVLRSRTFSRLRGSASLRWSESSYHTEGWWAVFTARFTPFLRAVVFLTAGMSRMPVRHFLAADLLSASFFVPPVLLAGHFLAENRELLIAQVREAEVLVASVLILVLVLMFFFHGKRGSGKGGGAQK